MSVPAFTADASVYQTANRYRSTATSTGGADRKTTVQPAYITCESGCGGNFDSCIYFICDQFYRPGPARSRCYQECYWEYYWCMNNCIYGI